MKDKINEVNEKHGFVFGARTAKPTAETVKVEAKALSAPKVIERKPSGEIIDYEVIQEPKIEDLKRMVRQHIKAGWIPIGGVSYCERMGHWYQALVFRDI